MSCPRGREGELQNSPGSPCPFTPNYALLRHIAVSGSQCQKSYSETPKNLSNTMQCLINYSGPTQTPPPGQPIKAPEGDHHVSLHPKEEGTWLRGLHVPESDSP